MIEIILLFVGGLVGVLTDRVYKIVQRALASRVEKRRLNKRRRLTDAAAVNNWLLAYYGNQCALYKCSISGCTKKIAFLTDDRMIWAGDLEDLDERIFLSDSKVEKKNHHVNADLINKRQNMGQTLFNNDTYYLKSISLDKEGFRINIGITEYFAVASNLIALEEETFSAVWGKKKSTPIRDESLPSLTAFMQHRLDPLSFGVVVGFVLNRGSERMILLQVRSEATVTNGGSRALIPSFGLEPFSGASKLSAVDVVYHNIIKEYLEEFYDYEQLIDTYAQRRVDPIWFVQLPEAREFDDAKADGRIKTAVLGCGVDCMNATTVLSLLVEVTDPILCEKIIRETVGNWEVAQPSSERQPLELVELYSSRLADYLSQGSFHPGSAFTVSLMQQFYRPPR